MSVLALVLAAIAAVTPALPTSPAEAQTPKLGFYLAPPFVQTPYYAATIQDFNTGSSGTITSAETWAGISAPNGVTGTWYRNAGSQYGGATSVAPTNPGAPQLGDAASTRTNFASAGRIDIALAAPTTCLGFWWSAGDSLNGATVYTDSGQTLVATLTTATLRSMLGSNSSAKVITAINGTDYNQNGEYFGNPVTASAVATDSSTRDVPGEPFAYVHVIAQGGVTFDRIVLRQGQTGSADGFEFDNFAVATGCTVDPSLAIIDEDLLDPDFEQAFLASRQSVSQPASPVLTCNPEPVAPDGLVTCEVTEGPVDHEILWRASIDDPFASSGVMLDGSGQGTFTFRSPRGSSGRTISVELVSWNTSTTAGVSSLVPSRVDAGEGPLSPLQQPAFGLVGLLVLVSLIVRKRGPLVSTPSRRPLG